MAVEEREAGLALERDAECAIKVVRKEACVAVNAALALERQDRLGDDRCGARRARARAPEGEAEILLSVGANQMRCQLLERGAREGSGADHGCSGRVSKSRRMWARYARAVRLRAQPLNGR